MHQAESQTIPPVGPVHQERAYEFVECPMKTANGMSDIDPTNMVLKASLLDMILVRVCVRNADLLTVHLVCLCSC